VPIVKLEVEDSDVVKDSVREALADTAMPMVVSMVVVFTPSGAATVIPVGAMVSVNAGFIIAPSASDMVVGPASKNGSTNPVATFATE
jgi:hypothetical protein